MSAYANFEDSRIKHLEMIQGAISRLGGNGFLVKGWALTVSGAFLGFAVNNDDGWLALASVFPTLVFWGLDAYFLRAERLFRNLFDCVRADGSVTPFFMNATSDEFTAKLSDEERKKLTWVRTVVRPSLVWFYIAILAGTAVIFLALAIGAKTGQPLPVPSSSTPA